jgi:hypothetical protein
VIDYLKKNGLYDTLAHAAGIEKDATASDVHRPRRSATRSRRRRKR